MAYLARLESIVAYMYPSRRSVSSPPPSSLSCARPDRSAMLANFPVLELEDDVVHVPGVRLDRLGAGPAAQRAVALAVALVVVERDRRESSPA